MNNEVLIRGEDSEWFNCILILNDKFILRKVIFWLVIARFYIGKFNGERMSRVREDKIRVIEMIVFPEIQWKVLSRDTIQKKCDEY